MFATFKKIVDRSLAYFGAAFFGFPSRRLVVIGVTGTEGKREVVENLSRIFAAGGVRVAWAHKDAAAIDSVPEVVPVKTTSSPHFALQKFLRDAKRAGCTHVVLELSASLARESAHAALLLDALVVTSLYAEEYHLAEHGTWESYRDSKYDIVRTLLRSTKHRRVLVVNAGDDLCRNLLGIPRAIGVSYGRHQMVDLQTNLGRYSFVWNFVSLRGRGVGEAAARHGLAAATTARELGLPMSAIVEGLAA